MKRSFIYLTVVTLVAVLVLFLYSHRNGPAEPSVNGQLFLPLDVGQINQVTRVEIISAGDHPVATLIRNDDGWHLEQMGGYRADWTKLRTLLAALAQARVVEEKTDNPEYYARLGVEDVTGANADSVLVRLSNGDRTTGVLVGHRAEGRQGQYLRLEGSGGSVLVDRAIDVPTELLDWADSRIIDIPASEVAEVEIIHPGGENLLVIKVSQDHNDFDLVDLPQDREVKSSWAVNSLGSAFSVLNMKSVRPAEDVDWSDAVRIRLLTFSGLEIIADTVEAGDEYLLRLSASHPEASVAMSGEEDQQGNDEQQEIEKKAKEDVAARVDEINQRVSGWAYGIAKFKYDALVKKTEDLLKPLESS